ncbi:intracellular ribonuclease LX-like [Aristolochia californica]|uniref:intracellular ribonuclease LX-like n=1 Tax=Aristolochia californica TaxID=171875 RepID=UPI0035DAD9A3
MAYRFVIAALVTLLSCSASLAQDQYFLYLRWPGGLCSKGECCFHSTYPRQNDFVIHYLARSFTSGSYPQCNPNPFYAAALQNFVQDMYKYWPSFNCPAATGVEEWGDAWNDNGKCSGIHQPQYFQRAINLTKDANVLDKLARKGILPSESNTYSLVDVMNAINEGLGANTAVINCGANANSVLRNVRLCLDPTASFATDCIDKPPNICAERVQLLPLANNTVEDENPIEMVTSGVM